MSEPPHNHHETLSDAAVNERLVAVFSGVFGNSVDRLQTFAARFTDASGQSMWQYVRTDTFVNATADLLQWFRASNQLDDLIIRLADKYTRHPAIHGFLANWCGADPASWNDRLTTLIPRLRPLEGIDGLKEVIFRRTQEWRTVVSGASSQESTLSGLAVSVLSAGHSSPADPPTHVRLLNFTNAIVQEARLRLKPDPGGLEDLNAHAVSRLEEWVGDHWKALQTPLGTPQSRWRWLIGAGAALTLGLLIGWAGWGFSQAELNPRLHAAVKSTQGLSRELLRETTDRKTIENEMKAKTLVLQELKTKIMELETDNRELTRHPIGMTPLHVRDELIRMTPAFKGKLVQFVAYVAGEYVGTLDPRVVAHPTAVDDMNREEPIRVYLVGSAVVGDRPREPILKRWAIFTGTFGTPTQGNKTTWAVNSANYLLIDAK